MKITDAVPTTRPARVSQVCRGWLAKRPAAIYKPTGCLECRMTGFIGRVGVYETLMCSSGIKEIVGRGGDLAKIRELAYREGMKALRISGAMKVAAGYTTIEEVMKTAPPAVEAAS